MTKEELEKEAEEYLENKHCKNVCIRDEIEECKQGIRLRCTAFDYRKKLIVKFAEPREKRIAELEVTNKKISNECHKLVDSLEKKQKEIAELEAQIEKMKCCENCQHWEGREPIPSLAEEGYYCFNDYPFECKRWELAEELKEIKEK